jgi:hypothetical protein
MPRSATRLPAPCRQAVWFVAYWLAGVLIMGLVTGVLETGMRLLR